MITLPRGIQKLERKNKDGSTVIAFRVQMKRKDIVVDQLFSSVDEALNWRIQIRSATPVDSMNEGGMLRAVDQQLSVHSKR